MSDRKLINNIIINNTENKSDNSVIIINNFKKNVKTLLHKYKEGEILDKMDINDKVTVLKSLADTDT